MHQVNVSGLRRRRAMIVASVAICAQAALAAPRSWTLNASGSWNVPANWTPNGVPSGGDNVFISPTASGVVVTLDPTVGFTSPTSVVVDSSSSVAVAPQLLQTGSTLSPITITFGSAGVGSFRESGGTLNVSEIDVASLSGSIGTMTLNSGSISTGNFLLGASGTGSMRQTGGYLQSSFQLSVGLAGGTGTYQLDGGTLNATGSIVLGAGTGGFGAFNQTAGTLTTGSLTVGSASGSRGVVNLDGGTLIVFSTEAVGSFSAGTFNQTGGYHQPGQLLLGAQGVYNLSGGTLQFPVLTLLGGKLNFTGGTLRQASGVFSIDSTSALGTTLTLGPTQRLEDGSGTVSVGSTSLLIMQGGTITAGAGFQNNGQVILNSLTSQINAPAITNQGLLTGNGRVSGNMTNLGELRADPGDDIRVTGGISNSGSFTLNAGIIESTGPLTNGTGGKIVGRGTLRAASITNNGTMIFSAGMSDIFGAVTNTTIGAPSAPAKIIITGGGTTTFYDNLTNAGTAELRVSSGSRAVFLSNVTGTGLITGTGAKDFEGATNTPGPIVAGGDTIVGPDANLSTTLVREKSLDVQGAASLTTDLSDTHTTSRVTTLTIAGAGTSLTGKLDLGTNNLIVDDNTTTPIATIAALVKAGYNNGAWNGPGIRSSAAQANTGAHATAVGYALAGSLGLTSFDSLPVNLNSTLLAYTLKGDANLDGKVNALDFNLLATNFGKPTTLFWNNGDFNYDNVVNTSDFTALAANFNAPLPAPALGALVPEPCTAIGLLACFAIRRRRR